jgi:hypothetical protein
MKPQSTPKPDNGIWGFHVEYWVPTPSTADYQALEPFTDFDEAVSTAIAHQPSVILIPGDPHSSPGRNALVITHDRLITLADSLRYSDYIRENFPCLR